MAVITGFEVLGGAADDELLNGGNLFRRNFYAQVAARHHDAVGDLENGVEMLDRLRLFQLGDDPGVETEGGHAVAHQAHVFGRAHKRDGDGVDAVLKRELQIPGVLLRQRGCAHQHAGKIDAFVLAQQAAIHDVAGHVFAVDLVHAQLDQSVGEQNARALLHVFGQSLEGGAHARCRARHLAGRDDELMAGLEQHRQMILEQPGANLGPLQVTQDAQRLVLFLAQLADLPDDGGFALVAAVGEIEADDVDAGADQLANDRLCVGGRPERGDNLGAALRWGFRQIEVGKGHGGGSRIWL